MEGRGANPGPDGPGRAGMPGLAGPEGAAGLGAVEAAGGGTRGEGVGRGGRTILRGTGLAGSGSGSGGTTAVRAGSAALLLGSAARRGAGSGSSGTGAAAGALSMILIRERALFWGRKALDSVSRTISCLGACVLPWRMAVTVASSKAACGDLTSTPIDWRRKRTSLLPTPICWASSSTRIFPMNSRLLPGGSPARRLGNFGRALFRGLFGFLFGSRRRLLEGVGGSQDLLSRLLADPRQLGQLRGRLLEQVRQRRDPGLGQPLSRLLADAGDVRHGRLLVTRGLEH